MSPTAPRQLPHAAQPNLAADFRRGRPDAPAPRPVDAAGFTLTEVVVALGLTLLTAAGFLVFLRQARLSLELQPELAAMRQDGRAMLDRIADDLARAGSGLPVEIPVFTDIGPAGVHDPDGLDFLAAPAGFAETGFEPVVGFDGRTVRLGTPDSRLAAGSGTGGGPFAVVFNDDEMLPRWAFGRVESVERASGGLTLGALSALAQEKPPPAPGASVRIGASRNPWHWHFRPSVDGATFEPGGGGGLLERGLQSVLGGFIEAALPGMGQGPLAELTKQVAGALIEQAAAKAGMPGAGTGGTKGGALPGFEKSEPDGYGLFGLGQPGLVRVERIRYEVRTPPAGAADSRRVLLRRVDEEAPQPVGFVEDLQIHYLTGPNGETRLRTPPGFAGDMVTARRLGDHVVRGVEVVVEVRAAGSRLAAAARDSDGAGRGDGSVVRTYRRRVALRVTAAGVGRRAWEERMQLNSLPTEIPRIGPLRFIPWPW